MGTQPYKILENELFDELIVTEDNIVLEIGSERGEGSSIFLYEWAKKRGISFFSVDVLNDAKEKYNNPDINFEVYDTGHGWCKDILPNLGKTIKVLYLDNFDWIDENNLKYEWMHELIDSYGKRGVTMNNLNSQEEHRLQSLYCIPYMDECSIVIFDDTRASHLTPTGYDGKSGTAIPLFIQAGYEIKKDFIFGLYAQRNLFL
jgi:hypothetical protein